MSISKNTQFIKFKKTAFTLSEMMVVLLIISIVLAAMMPILTSRARVRSNPTSSTSIWKWTDKNNVDIYFGTNSIQDALIGLDSSGYCYGALQINVPSAAFNYGNKAIGQITFGVDNIPVGSLIMDNDNNILLGEISAAAYEGTGTIGYTPGKIKNSILIGHDLLSENYDLVNVNEVESAIFLGDKTTAGNYAIAIGYWATALDYATAIGVGSVANQNSVAIGSCSMDEDDPNAGKNTTAPEYGVTLGSEGNSDRPYSVTIGSGAYITSPSSGEGGSIAIGEGAGISNSGESIVLGYNAKITDNTGASIAIGKGATITGGYKNLNIGNGTMNNYKNSVSIGIDNSSFTNSYSYNIAIGGFTPGDYSINIGGPSLVTTSGSANNHRISLSPNVYINGDLVLGVQPQKVSDARLKNISGDYKSGLDTISKINIVNFTFKNDNKKRKQIGVIAQDLLKIIPDAVSKDDKGFFSVDYSFIWCAAVNAVKEINSKFNVLVAFNNSQINCFKKKITENENFILIFNNSQLHNKNIALNSKINQLNSKNAKMKAQIAQIQKDIAQSQYEIKNLKLKYNY